MLSQKGGGSQIVSPITLGDGWLTEGQKIILIYVKSPLYIFNSKYLMFQMNMNFLSQIFDEGCLCSNQLHFDIICVNI